MNSLDIIIIAIMVLVGFRGFCRGLIHEAVSLCSLLIGIFVASRLHVIFVPHLKVYIQSPGTVQALSYLITFLATMVALFLLVRFLKGVLKITMLTGVDKLAGAAFGCLEGLLFSLVVLLLMKAVMPNTALIKQSVFAKHTDPALVLLANFTPEPVRETLEEGGFALPKPLEMPPPRPKGQNKGLNKGQPQSSPMNKGKQTI